MDQPLGRMEAGKVRRAHRFAVFTGILALLLALASSVSAQERKVVFYYNWGGAVGAVEEFFLRLEEGFEKENPDIDVEMVRGGVVSGNADLDRLLTLIAAGTPPDVVHFERSIVTEFAAKGYLRPVDDIVGSIEDEFVPGTIQEVLFRGKTYGVPFGTDIRGLFWNKDDLAETGYDVDRGPQTIEELDEMAARLTRPDGEGGFSRLGFIPWLGNWYAPGWLYTFGGDILDGENMAPRVNTPNHIRGFDWIQEYGQRYPYDVVGATLAGQPHTTFYGQRLSMIVNYHGWANLVTQSIPSLEYGVGEMPHPPEGSNGTWLGGQAYVIPAGSRNVDEAAKLLEYVTRKEHEVAMYRIGHRLPTRWTAVAEIEDELTPVDAMLLRQADVAWGRPPLWYPPFYTITNEAQVKVARLQETPQAALDEAQRQLEQAFLEILGE